MEILLLPQIHAALVGTEGGAIKVGVVVEDALGGGGIDASGKLIFKSAMFALPLVFILVGYVVYLKKYKIDEQFYGEILRDLESK